MHMLETYHYVTGREVSSPCGTPASHTTRVSLVEVTQYQLVFALPWARQENGSSSQPVCVGFRLNPSSRLSHRLATNSPNSTGSACLKSKECRAIVFPTRTPLKHVSNNQHNYHRHKRTSAYLECHDYGS